MLSGEFRHSVDAKNRLFIPAKHREELCELTGNENAEPQSFMVTKHVREKCLCVYSMKNWEDYIAPILKLERKDMEIALRALHKDAAQVTPDSQGRIILTPTLMRYAGIEKSVVIVGCAIYDEIWSEQVYDEKNNVEDLEDSRAILEKYGL